MWYNRARCPNVTSRREINDCVRLSDQGELIMTEISKAMRKEDGIYDIFQIHGELVTISTDSSSSSSSSSSNMFIIYLLPTNINLS